mmetsp:Transcript_6953/g.18650  ORF Transcript_6953/g.18650 Transcript_6953/m.18650 type:complete len:442 (+) Transcript_6953:138-1463(+)
MGFVIAAGGARGYKRGFGCGARQKGWTEKASVVRASRAVNMAAEEGSERIVIVGAGIMGAATAFFLAKRGQARRVVVLEALEVAASASGKAGGFLAPEWGDGSPTEQLHRVSFALHKQLAKELNVESFREIPTLELNVSRKGGGKRGQSKPEWLSNDVSSRVMDRNTGQVEPKELTQKLLASAVSQGCVVRTGTSVDGIETVALGDGEAVGKNGERSKVTGVRIKGGEVVPCSQVLIAAGIWSVVAAQWLNVRLPMRGYVSSSILLPGAGIHSGVERDPFALFCSQDSNGCSLEVYPRPSGDVYVCGIGGSRTLSPREVQPGAEIADAAAVTPNSSRATLALRSLTRIAPAITGACTDETGSSEQQTPEVTVQACIRPCADDAIPIISRVPRVRGAYMATGHNCWGILWGPATGKAMSELILDGTSKTLDLTPFQLQRFQK